MLTDEQLAHIQEDKAERRRAEQETNTIGSRKYCCETCFHLKTQACDGLTSLEKVCEYWFDLNSSIQGLAYWRQEQEAGAKNHRAGVVAAVGTFLAGKSRPKKQHQAEKQKTQGQLW